MPYDNPDEGAFRESAKAATAIADLVDNSGGTADGTLAAVEATYTQATIRNNFADIVAKQNAMLAALRTAGLLKP